MASTPPRRRIPTSLFSGVKILQDVSRDDSITAKQCDPVLKHHENPATEKGSSTSPARRWRIASWSLLVFFLCFIVMILRYTHSSGGCSGNGDRMNGEQPLTSFRGSRDSDGAPPDHGDRPFYDLVIAVLVVGGDSPEAQAEIERVRRVYARYGDCIEPTGESAEHLSFRYVFVVGKEGLSQQVPETGLLLGDFFHVDVREGYSHLSDKTKAMMALTEHLSFRFLAKTDGDTFPCLGKVTQQLVDMPRADQSRVYAGLLATCGKVFPEGHKLHDPEFRKATGGVLPCHPMYHQGAFYVLGEDIVRHLYRSRDLLTVMSVEDAMVGLWLLGIDKVILDIGGQFYCQCFTHPVPAKAEGIQSFYHFCKTEEKINGCIKKFGSC